MERTTGSADDLLQIVLRDCRLRRLESFVATHFVPFNGAKCARASLQLLERLKAWQQQQVKTDPVAYILSANINRRHLTKSQRAMAVAMIYPEKGKGGRGKKTHDSSVGFSHDVVNMARTVLQYASDLKEGVLNGSVALNEAGESLTR